MFVTGFISALSILNLHAKSIDINNEPICITEICNKTAARMKEIMDLNIDPCDDFYQYACGNWPDNENGALQFIQNKINEKVEEILRATPPSDETTPMAKAKIFYNSCMNTDKIESEGISDLLKILNRNGGWPIVMSENDWISKQKSWQEVDLAIRKVIDRSPIFSLSAFDILTDNSSAIVLLKYENMFPANILDFDALLSLPETIQFMDTIKNVSQIIANHRNYSLSEKTLEVDVKNMIKFVWELNLIISNSTTELLRQNGDMFDLISIDDFQKSYNLTCKTENSKIDWLDFIKQYFADVPDININGSQTIAVIKNFFLLLSDLLDRTPSRVIVNALHWQFMVDIHFFMHSEIKTLFEKLFYGPLNPTESRHSFCIKYVYDQLKHALDYGYVQNHFSDKVRNISIRMISEITYEMEVMINSSTLIVNHTRSNLFTSLKKVKWFVGYPDWYDNKTEIDHFYDDIKMNNSWLENMMVAKTINLNHNLKSLRELNVRKRNWPHSSAVINAFHIQPLNAIYFGAGNLDGLVIDEYLPNALNYGKIATVIGHELTHAVLSSATNNIINRLTHLLLMNNLVCFSDQLSNYSLFLNNRTYQVNRPKTLNENVADNVGVRAAYKALQTREKIKMESKMRLPGLEHLNSNQLFFLSYAQIRCSLDSPEVLLQEMNDPHGPSVFRINGTLSNNENFAEAFKCAKGTIMNPTRKCLLL